jgi:hypothetical protein
MGTCQTLERRRKKEHQENLNQFDNTIKEKNNKRDFVKKQLNEDRKILINNIKNKVDKSDKYNNNLENIYNNILNMHNNIRKKIGYKNLDLNNDLSLLAQKTADNFDILEESNFQIENYNNKPLGINYEKFNEDNSKIKDICEKWIKEGNKKQINNFSKIKHFTQIIWKNTEEIGIGYSELNNKEKILVILYYPAGNIFEEFDNNIPKGIFLEEKDKPKSGEN